MTLVQLAHGARSVNKSIEPLTLGVYLYCCAKFSKILYSVSDCLGILSAGYLVNAVRGIGALCCNNVDVFDDDIDRITGHKLTIKRLTGGHTAAGLLAMIARHDVDFTAQTTDL